MKYTKEERLDIGRRIYDGEISKYTAAEKYGISVNCARDYMRSYRDINGLDSVKRSLQFHSEKINYAAVEKALRMDCVLK